MREKVKINKIDYFENKWFDWVCENLYLQQTLECSKLSLQWFNRKSVISQRSWTICIVICVADVLQDKKKGVIAICVHLGTYQQKLN